MIYLLSSMKVIDCADCVYRSLVPVCFLWILRVKELAEDCSSLESALSQT